VTEDATLQAPTVTGFAAKCAIAALRKHNVAVQPLLHRAGLSELNFGNPRHRVSAIGQIKFLEYAAEAMDDAAFGLHLAEQSNPREAGPWIPERSATRLGEADLNVLSKLGNQGLEWRLEPEAFTGGEVGREDDLLDVLVGCAVDIQVARQPST
jgi:Arabinose-binding domain of AraC transcription regulator, N-term